MSDWQDPWRTAALLKDRTRQAIRERHKAGESVLSLADDFMVPVQFIDALVAFQLFGDPPPPASAEKETK